MEPALSNKYNLFAKTMPFGLSLCTRSWHSAWQIVGAQIVLLKEREFHLAIQHTLAPGAIHPDSPSPHPHVHFPSFILEQV